MRGLKAVQLPTYISKNKQLNYLSRLLSQNLSQKFHCLTLSDQLAQVAPLLRSLSDSAKPAKFTSGDGALETSLIATGYRKFKFTTYCVSS